MPMNPHAKVLLHPAATLFLLISISIFPMGIPGCTRPYQQAQPVPAPPAPYWPTNGWKKSTPEQQGMDSSILADAINTIRARGLALHSLLIVRHGHVVVDAYFYPYSGKTVHDVASVTKSVMATLIQIALEQGYLKGLEQPVVDFFPHFRRDVKCFQFWRKHVTPLQSRSLCPVLPGGLNRPDTPCLFTQRIGSETIIDLDRCSICLPRHDTGA